MRARAIGLFACCCLARLTVLPLALCHAADPQPRTAAADSAATPDKDAGPQTGADEASRRDDRFRRLVTNVTLSGHFTMDGDRETKLTKEEYVITGAAKLGKGDTWVLTTRIRYGTVDVAVPVPVEVKWAGETPVITLDKVGVPGLGTFSARVVLDEGRYAGTWSHDDVGGHLFGTIAAAAGQPRPAPPRPASGTAPAGQVPAP